MISKELDRLKGNQGAIDLYRTGMNQVFQSGAIDALRMLGRPAIVEGGKDINTMATQAAWSAGWNQCLDALLYFPELYLQEAPQLALPKMDFGASERAVNLGLMSKEEANAIRSDSATHYDPKQYTSNLPELPKRPKSAS